MVKEITDVFLLQYHKVVQITDVFFFIIMEWLRSLMLCYITKKQYVKNKVVSCSQFLHNSYKELTSNKLAMKINDVL